MLLRLFCKYLFIKLNINFLLGRNIVVEHGYAFVTADSNVYNLCGGGGGEDKTVQNTDL